MEPTITLYSSILLLGAAHGLFLALALLNVKRGNRTAHRLLALLTLTFAADLAVDFLHQSNYLLFYPKLTLIEQVTSFLYGPLTYFYVIVLTDKQGFHFSRNHIWHFLPFIIGIALLIPFFSLSDAQIVELVYNDADAADFVGLWVLGALAVVFVPIVQIGSYLVISVRRLLHHSRDIRGHFSSIERISLVWLRNLLIGVGLLYLVYLFAVFFSEALGIGAQLEQLLDLGVVIVIYTIGYMGIRQPAIFVQKPNGSQTAIELPTSEVNLSKISIAKKYQRSALDTGMSHTLLQELQRIMVDDKPHLDPTLTLSQLAATMQISTNYLSQIINQQTGNNFFDYINQFRVAEAKRLLGDPVHKRSNILAIAMDAGFNSKSAFYTAFKRHTGATPSKFRQSLAQS